MMEQCLLYVSETKQNERQANHILSPSVISHVSALSLSLVQSRPAALAVSAAESGVRGNWSHQSTRVAIGLD